MNPKELKNLSALLLSMDDKNVQLGLELLQFNTHVIHYFRRELLLIKYLHNNISFEVTRIHSHPTVRALTLSSSHAFYKQRAPRALRAVGVLTLCALAAQRQ